MFYLVLTAIALIGIGIGLAIGTDVYDSRIGTAIGTILCSAAFVLLVRQLFVWPATWLPTQIALGILVLVMESCAAGQASRHAAADIRLQPRQAAIGFAGILAGACLFAFLMGLL